MFDGIPKEEGTKHDQEKVRLDLLPVDVLEGAGKVLTVGVSKYEERNWEKGMKWSRVYRALLSHLWAFWRGEEFDPETQLPHIDHVVTNAMFLARYWRSNREWDDRPFDSNGCPVNWCPLPGKRVDSDLALGRI